MAASLAMALWRSALIFAQADPAACCIRSEALPSFSLSACKTAFGCQHPIDFGSQPWQCHRAISPARWPDFQHWSHPRRRAGIPVAVRQRHDFHNLQAHIVGTLSVRKMPSACSGFFRVCLAAPWALAAHFLVGLFNFHDLSDIFGNESLQLVDLHGNGRVNVRISGSFPGRWWSSLLSPAFPCPGHRLNQAGCL